MKKLLLFVCINAILVSSCKKNESSCDLNAASLAGSYKITAIKYKLNATSPEVDAWSLTDACIKDDIIVLNANNTANYTDAGTACTPPGNETGTWALSGNTFTATDANNSTVSTISDFNCSGFILTYTATGGYPIVTYTYVRQ